MFSGNLFFNNIRQIKQLQKKKLRDHKELMALHYTDREKYKSAIATLKKFSIPYETEDLVLFIRLVVPSDAVQCLDGFVSRALVIPKKQLPKFVQTHLREKTKTGWHGKMESTAFKAVLDYRYFIVDYVKKHISHYAEALRLSKLLPDKT